MKSGGRFIGRLALGVVLGVQPATAQSTQSTAPTEPTKAVLAESLAVRAMRFSQGDAHSLTVHQPDFTDSAWIAFLKELGNLLDAQGAPRFGAWFMPSGPATLIGTPGEVMHLRIPGVRTQSTHAGHNTHYESNRVLVNAVVGGMPLRIRSLSWTTCAGDAPRNACM